MPIKLKNLKPGDLLVDVNGGQVGFVDNPDDDPQVRDTEPNTRYMVKSVGDRDFTMFCFATGKDTLGWRCYAGKSGDRYIHPDLRRVK